MMVRLNFVVEGQTEEGFVNRVLAPYFGMQGIYCSARSIETSRNRRKNKIYRGGHRTYMHLKSDLLRWLKQDDNPDVFFTTMIDLYALPSDFPSYEDAQGQRFHADPFKRVAHLEGAFQKDIQHHLTHSRFIPYIQLHEFEALLLCEPSVLSQRYPGRKKDASELVQMCATFDCPDLIDDGDKTSPSKRIIERIPEYENEKSFAGPLIAEWIGLDKLRKCRHFSDWLDRLSKLKA